MVVVSNHIWNNVTTFLWKPHNDSIFSLKVVTKTKTFFHIYAFMRRR